MLLNPASEALVLEEPAEADDDADDMVTPTTWWQELLEELSGSTSWRNQWSGSLPFRTDDADDMVVFGARRDAFARGWLPDGSFAHVKPEVKELPQGADMIWVLDFSARMHSTGNLGLLHRLPSSLQDTDDCLPSLWRGSIRTEQFEIPDVRYVRGDPRNVISVAQLARSHGLVTIFEPPNAYVTDDPATGKEVGRAHLRDDGVYVLDHLRISKPQSLMEIYQDNCLALEKALDDERADPVDLPFLFLKAITKDFSDDQRIGSGGYGTVYKGAIQNRMVAVKKLHDRVDVLEKNFQREIDSLIEVKHKNIVRFLGYCSDTQELMKLFEGKYVLAEVRQRLFCFEYLSNGSLADRLTEASSGLQWGVWYQIIKGICNGLLYLHQRKIIHMDLKPENILLDDSMVPRIADFGLSRCFGENQTRAITENQAGTRGYMAPELLRDGIITLETDIFSLGVIIAYILMESKERPNVHKVLERWMNTFGTSENHALLEQVKVCAEIGRNCMDDNPSKRPAIQDIICRLDEMDISNSSVRSVGTTTTLAGQV